MTQKGALEYIKWNIDHLKKETPVMAAFKRALEAKEKK
jgi:hypothetical protein